MPLEIQYGPIHGLTRVTGRGNIPASDIMAMVESFERRIAVCNIIWDLREAVLKDVTPEFIQNLALKIKRLTPTGTKGRTVVVSSTDFIFGLSRMLKAMIEYPDETKARPFMVFRNMADAEVWLEEAKCPPNSDSMVFSELVYQR